MTPSSSIRPARPHRLRRTRGVAAAGLIAVIGVGATSGCSSERDDPDNRQEIEGRETPDTQRPPSTGAPAPDKDGNLTTTTAPGDVEGDEGES